jgi:hypothetical protein
MEKQEEQSIERQGKGEKKVVMREKTNCKKTNGKRRKKRGKGQKWRVVPERTGLRLKARVVKRDRSRVSCPSEPFNRCVSGFSPF